MKLVRYGRKGAEKPDMIFLKPGDVMRLGISGLGVQQQMVVAWRDISGDAQ